MVFCLFWFAPFPQISTLKSVLTRSVKLLLLAQNLHEALGHVVGLLLGSVVAFAVFQETQEQRVHRDRVHAKENRRNDVRPDKHQNRRDERIVQLLRGSTVEERVRNGRHATGQHQLRQEEQEPGHLVHRNHPQNVPGQQAKRVLCTRAKALPVNRTHDVRVRVQELQKALQAPETALAKTQNRLNHPIVVLPQLVIDILQCSSNDLANCNYQRPESQRAQMVSHGAKKSRRKNEKS